MKEPNEDYYQINFQGELSKGSIYYYDICNDNVQDVLYAWYLELVSYYDFDIYSKGNYFNIVEEVKKIMKNNGFMWQPNRTSQDMYEADTGYYHKTLCFAIERQEIEYSIPSI